MKKLLTYFTPTYNRANLLQKLYKSLLLQTDNNFNWLIVDDGSNDDTEEIVNKWIKERKISIQYVKKENGGKHTTIDVSNEMCTTQYICCVDSDDYLTNTATEIIYKYLKKINSKDDVVGLVGRKFHFDNTPFQNEWPESEKCIYFSQLKDDYGYKSETVLVFKTEIIKRFKFPSIPEERFITEKVFYNQFLYDYKLLTFNENVYRAEYLETGYSNDGLNLLLKNPKGYLYYLQQEAYIVNRLNKNLLYKILKISLFYQWKNILKKECSTDYLLKIKKSHRVLGKILSPLLYFRCKRKFKKIKNV